MKLIIIPSDIVEKLTKTEFQKPHALEPVRGELDGKAVYFLPYELKESKIFEKALADFEICEVKEIETVEPKFYDSKGIEIFKSELIDNKTGNLIVKYYDSENKEVDLIRCISKTVLTAESIKGIKE